MAKNLAEAFLLIRPGFYRVYFRDREIGELSLEELVLELHDEWSEFADECIALKSTVEPRITYPERRLFG